MYRCRIHHAHNRPHFRDGVCQIDLGKVLELGPKGDLVSNNVAVICNASPWSSQRWLARAQSSHSVYYRIYSAFIYLLWCQLPAGGASWGIYQILKYYLNPAPTIYCGLKRLVFKARFMILILTI